MPAPPGHSAPRNDGRGNNQMGQGMGQHSATNNQRTRVIALGEDPYSEGIMSMASAENVKTDLVIRVPGRMPGIYTIETDTRGERRFHYWRDNSPARDLFDLPDWGRVAEAMIGARLIYFSG